MIDPGATATGLYSQQRLAAGTVLAGRFRIESVLGIGGMGVVYRASDVALDVPVALKLLRPELASRADAFDRFRQELLTARQVSSPHVVRIHDLAQDQGQWFITMDLIEGEGLDRRIDRDGPLPPDDAIAIARQLAEGLAAAHARGVVHRDLKPANVLIDREGRAYITDFGVARSLATGGLTQSGAVVGTPDYLSPEQARGEQVDARSDLYALGLILYEMLTGAMPFAGGTVPEILAQRMLRTPPPVTQLQPQTPTWVARLVDRLLRPQPAHRLQSAGDVIRAIDRREVPREWRPQRRGWIVAAVALLIALLGAGTWYIVDQREVAPGVATIAPLHRLLVLPLEAPAELLDPPQRVALGAQLREALGAAPGLAVVDQDRTYQALRQLDPTGSTQVDPDALQRIVGADRALRVSLAPGPDGMVATAVLQRTGLAPASVTATGADPAAALRNLLAQPALVRALGTESLPPLSAPESAEALTAYGAGLQARREDRPADALQRFAAATTAAPEFGYGWLAQAEAASAIGEQDAAFDALERGLRAADTPPALQRRLQAELAMLEGDAPTAAAQWRQQLQATPDDTFAELNLARALGGGGDFPAAIAALQKLVERDPNDPRAWFELGKFSILHGEAQRAVDDHLVRALVLYKRSGNRFGEAETVNALGIGYNRLGQVDDAEEQFRKAVELREALGNRRGLATSLRNLGNVLALSGRFDEAAQRFEQARALHAELGDQEGLAAVENELGLLAEERGDYAGALTAFRRALKLWQQIGHKAGIAKALNDIGFVQYQLGAYDDAQAYLVQSTNAYEAIGDRTGQIRTQQNLGQLAIARGQWDEARRQLQASLESAERNQMYEEAAVSLRNLAELELLQGHLDVSLRNAARAEALFEQRGDARGRVDAALLRVQALLAAGSTVQARDLLAQLSPLLEDAPPEQRAIASLIQSRLASQAGDPTRQARELAQAARLAQASGVRHLQLQVALERAARVRDAELESALASLGHMALRLRWSEAAMREALAAGEAEAAVELYRDALTRLRRGDYLHAAELHDIGARALEASGDTHGAAVAREHAARARATLRRHLPRANATNATTAKPAVATPGS
ncbi:tetratricopeptide repeat protein [Lysobacter korlensis]|uniref:Tetratricopeptide repeat protein n=1 Tax=Lysobacter korlensis TaxID=553636 RepID=A0ABV6RPM0_9GAMM